MQDFPGLKKTPGTSMGLFLKLLIESIPFKSSFLKLNLNIPLINAYMMGLGFFLSRGVST